jgi:hypothetical protein
VGLADFNGGKRWENAEKRGAKLVARVHGCQAAERKGRTSNGNQERGTGNGERGTRNGKGERGTRRGVPVGRKEGREVDEEARMVEDDGTTFEGGCTCRAVRYRMTSKPMFVHCCHCRWCQRETGASFALNALVEADRVVLTSGTVEVVDTPTNSGKGQRVSRCPTCRIALWSNYSGAGDKVRFVRVGTLDEPDRLPPDVHIYTASKQPWVVLPPGAPAFAEYYKSAELWPAESLERRRVALGG